MFFALAKRIPPTCEWFSSFTRVSAVYRRRAKVRWKRIMNAWSKIADKFHVFSFFRVFESTLRNSKHFLYAFSALGYATVAFWTAQPIYNHANGIPVALPVASWYTIIQLYIFHVRPTQVQLIRIRIASQVSFRRVKQVSILDCIRLWNSRLVFRCRFDDRIVFVRISLLRLFECIHPNFVNSTDENWWQHGWCNISETI